MENTVSVPHFLVAGMPRAATTYLYHNLGKHPSIFLPFRKEVMYFSSNHDKGRAWYESLYDERQAEQVCGDVSPPSFLDDRAIERISAHNPELKVILAVRDPVEWALSMYAQYKSFTFDMPPFSKFLDGFDWKTGDKIVPVRIREDPPMSRVDEYRAAFGKNLLVYQFDYFRENTLEILRTIESFLGLDHYFADGNFDDIKINASARRNLKVVSYLLSREKTIAAIEKLVPRRLTLFLRSKFDFLSATGRPTRKGYAYSAEDRELAQTALAEQRTIYTSMFRDRPIQLGDGSELP